MARSDYSSSDSDSFEMPVSIHKHHARSRSRRRSPDRLAPPPPPIQPIIYGDLHRSRSTGARPRRDRDPKVVIDINNEVQELRNPQQRSRSQVRPPRQRYALEDEYEDDEWDEYEHRAALRPRARARAHSHASRDPSPYQYQHDLDMHMQIERLKRFEMEDDKRRQLEAIRNNERIRKMELEADRYDLEQQMQLEQMKRYREEEDTRKEIEKANRMQRLKQLERQEREEADRREMEAAQQIKKLKQMQKEEAAREEFENKLKLEKAEELEKKEAKKKQEEKIKQQILLEQAQQEAEEAERKKREKELKEKAIEEYTREQAEKKLKEEQEKAEADRIFEERVKREFGAAGYSERHIDIILKRKNDTLLIEEGRCESPHRHLSPPRPIPYIKVHFKHLAPETLDAHGLPWEWDERDANFIIIKKYVSEDVQEELFEHTRRIRERKMITNHSTTGVELKVNDRNRDKMFLVRKKSPKRSWIFT